MRKPTTTEAAAQSETPIEAFRSKLIQVRVAKNGAPLTGQDVLTVAGLGITDGWDALAPEMATSFVYEDVGATELLVRRAVVDVAGRSMADSPDTATERPAPTDTPQAEGKPNPLDYDTADKRPTLTRDEWGVEVGRFISDGRMKGRVRIQAVSVAVALGVHAKPNGTGIWLFPERRAELRGMLGVNERRMQDVLIEATRADRSSLLAWHRVPYSRRNEDGPYRIGGRLRLVQPTAEFPPKRYPNKGSFGYRGET